MNLQDLISLGEMRNIRTPAGSRSDPCNSQVIFRFWGGHAILRNNRISHHFGNSCADRRWPNSIPQQELGVGPGRYVPLYVSPTQCRCSRGELYWLIALHKAQQAN